MKNIKYILSGCLITLIILISYFLLNVNDLRKESIAIKEVGGYTKTITEFQNKVDKIKNDKCKESLNKYIEKLNNTYFDKDVTVEEYYKAYYADSKDTFSLYTDISDACEIENDEIYELVLEANTFPTEIKNKYNLSYEISILDKKSRKEINFNHDNIGSYTTKVLELKVLDEVLKLVNKK